MSSLSSRNIKPIILYVLLGLFAYSVAGALPKIMAERSLGSIFRHFLPTIPYIVLILLISVYDIKDFSFLRLVPQIKPNLGWERNLKGFILILMSATLVGLFILQYSPGLLVGPISLLLIISLVLDFGHFY